MKKEKNDSHATEPNDRSIDRSNERNNLRFQYDRLSAASRVTCYFDRSIIIGVTNYYQRYK